MFIACSKKIERIIFMGIPVEGAVCGDRKITDT